MTEAIPCREPNANPDDWFAGSDTPEALVAKKLCLSCPLYFPCQAMALEDGIPEGIFGGMDARTRRRLWKNRSKYPTGRPDVFDRAIDDAVRPLMQARRDASSTTIGTSWRERTA